MWHVPSSAWRVLATCWMGVLAVLTECAIISPQLRPHTVSPPNYLSHQNAEASQWRMP
jgi:hypothetical protein